MQPILVFLLISAKILSIEANFGTPSILGSLGCCVGGYNPYQGAMTPSGYPIYGMAPDASSSVAYSGPPPVYSYGSTSSGTYLPAYSSGGYGGGGGGGANYGSSAGYGGSGGIDFDSIPVGQIQPGMQVGQPIAVRYFNQPIPVNMNPALLRPVQISGPQGYMRVPLYGIIRGQNSQQQMHLTPYQQSINSPGFVSKYNKFRNNRHSVDSDIARGYQPAYSNWNKQPIQAVFRQAAPSASGLAESIPSTYSSGSESASLTAPSYSYSGHQAAVLPPELEELDSSPSSASSSSMPDLRAPPDLPASYSRSNPAGETTYPNYGRKPSTTLTQPTAAAAEVGPNTASFPDFGPKPSPQMAQPGPKSPYPETQAPVLNSVAGVGPNTEHFPDFGAAPAAPKKAGKFTDDIKSVEG